MAKQPLSHRLHYDPAYRDLVKMVGYQGRLFPFGQEETEMLFARHGKEKMKAAADEVIDYDHDAKLAKLKESVRKLCFAILGPAPEQEDWYYRHPDGTPMERPTAVNSVANHPDNPPPETPEPSEIELICAMHGRRLRQLPLSTHVLYQNHPPDDPTHIDAAQRMDLLETEMRKRKQKIPRRPNVREDIGVVAEALVEAIKDETGLGRAATNPEMADDETFRKHTTHRLKELLDMNQYELTRYDPESVTYQEAERDIGFIESELGRRSPPRFATPPEMTRAAMIQSLSIADLNRMLSAARHGAAHHGAMTGAGRAHNRDAKAAEAEFFRRGIAVPATDVDDDEG